MVDPTNPKLQLAFEQALVLCGPRVNQEASKKSTVASARNKGPALFKLNFKVGTHSNPLLTSSFNGLQVVLNGQNFILSNPEEAKPSSYQAIDLNLDYRFMKRNQVQLAASHTDYNRGKTSNYERFAFQYHRFYDRGLLSVIYNNQGFTNARYASLGARGIVSYNPNLFSSLSVSRTRYSHTSELDGAVVEASQFFVLPMSDTFKWQFALGYAIDRPLFDRAGGTQKTLQGSIGFEADINKHRLRLNTRLAKVDDSSVYSQILLNKPTRRLTNQHTQVKWSYLGLQDVEPALTLSYARQSSNITLFNWSYWSAEISAQIKW